MGAQKYYVLPVQTSGRVRLSCALLGEGEMSEVIEVWQLSKRLPADYYVGRWQRLMMIIEQGNDTAKFRHGQTIMLTDEDFWALQEVYQEDATIDVHSDGTVNLIAWDNHEDEYWTTFNIGNYL